MKKSWQGFTLVEMLLVLVIISSLVTLIANYAAIKTDQIKRDRTAIQMQQILSAGLAYYLNNGKWPNYTLTSSTGSCPASNLTALSNYLPSTMNPPYAGQAYSISCTSNGSAFTVSLNTNSASDATILAGMLPGGSVNSTTVTAQVTIPGQNLNNARSTNFAGYYHNGACVPAPTCPTGMTPDVLLTPVSMYGVNDATTSGPGTYYPLYGFTTFAFGTYSTSGTPSSTPGLPATIATCETPTTYAACTGGTGSGSIDTSGNTLYWRVCMKVLSTKGYISDTAGTPSGQYAIMMAITRCVPVNEPSGSDFTVWTQ